VRGAADLDQGLDERSTIMPDLDEFPAVRASANFGAIGKCRGPAWRAGNIVALGSVLTLAAPVSALETGVPPEPTLTVLHAFAGGTGGQQPRARLIADTDGNLYGTTERGGGSGCVGGACGTLFKLARDGTFTVLRSFAGGETDGEAPQAGLIADKGGSRFGTTLAGGGAGCDLIGCGTLFTLAPDGTGYKVPHRFAGGSGGAAPRAGLTAGTNGDLYGTTAAGGGSGCDGAGCGTLFKLAPDGTFAVLHRFAGGIGGRDPRGRLIADTAGNLYGTTYLGGGSGCDGDGCGTVFKLAPNGTFQVLHAFTGGDGKFPLSGLLADSAGTLYGTTSWGGGGGCSLHASFTGCGVVFKLAADGSGFAVLRSFTDGDGAHPSGGLIADGAGILFGTTENGGASACRVDDLGCGVVFKLAPDGTGFSTLHAFAGGNDGRLPLSDLIADSAGNLYGTTFLGGGSGCAFARGCGTVFELSGTGFVATTPFGTDRGATSTYADIRVSRQHAASGN
jgi:uncharacterized repeat protein (TIGR03803 family)